MAQQTTTHTGKRYVLYAKPRAERSYKGIADTQESPGMLETGLFKVRGQLVEGYLEADGSLNVGGCRVRKFLVFGKMIR